MSDERASQPGTSQAHIDEIEIILDENTEWFMEIVRSIFYPDQGRESKNTTRPETFAKWLRLARDAKLFKAEVLNDLETLNNDLGARAEKALEETRRYKNAPAYEEFDKLATFFEEFVNFLRRLEKESILGESGIDPLSGLRSKDMFFKDIAREMDRLARQGKAFSLAVICVDNFDKIRAGLKPAEFESAVKLIASLIKKSTRSFDDAYNMDGGSEYVIALKQTGTLGGIRALQRLKTSLDLEKIVYTIGGEKIPLTLSSCIAEPLPDDDIKTLLGNMKKDLQTEGGQASGAIVEYIEMSPLQRMLRENKA